MASQVPKTKAKNARAKARAARKEARKKSGKPVGRPSKFTPERVEKLLQALQLGAWRQTAASYAGISDTTFQDWMLLGRTELENGADGAREILNAEECEANPDVAPELGPVVRYAQLVGAVEDAEAMAEVRNLGHIQQAAETTWQAAAWFLERKNPKWGRPTAVQVSGPGGGPVKLDAEVTDKRGVVIMPALKEDD